MLNASRLHQLFNSRHLNDCNGTVSVLLPSGSTVYLQQATNDNVSEILSKVSNFFQC